MELSLEGLVLTVGGFLIGGLIAIVLWFVKRERDGIKTEIEQTEARQVERHDKIAEQVRRIERDVHGLRESLPDRYVTKADWTEFKGWISALLMRLELKLDKKVDREDCDRIHELRRRQQDED